MTTKLSSGNHGVIVVHGVGEQKKGEQIAEFGDQLAEALINSFQEEFGEECERPVRLDMNIDSDPESVILHIETPTGEKADWVCKEAYWADAFLAPSARDVLGWGFTKNVPVLWWAFLRILKCYGIVLVDPLNNAYTAEMYEAAKPQLPFSRSKRSSSERAPRTPPSTPLSPVKPKSADVLTPKLPWWAALFGRLVVWPMHLVSCFLSIFLAIVALPALFIYWVISHVPFTIKPLEDLVEWMRANTDPFFSKSIGDMTQYVENAAWSASMRNRLEKVIIEMLNDERLKDVTIVAHSMGGILTYETLSKNGNVAKEVNRLKNQAKAKKITFVSVGSGVNIAFVIANQKGCSTEGKNRIRQPLAVEITGPSPNMFCWIDIYARLDPVPAGYLSDEVIDVINENTLSREQVERRKVANKDDLFLDHFGYWRNHETVMPRIAKAINGGEYPWEREDKANKTPGITAKKLTRNFMDVMSWTGWKLFFIVLLVVFRGMLWRGLVEVWELVAAFWKWLAALL